MKAKATPAGRFKRSPEIAPGERWLPDSPSSCAPQSNPWCYGRSSRCAQNDPRKDARLGLLDTRYLPGRYSRHLGGRCGAWATIGQGPPDMRRRHNAGVRHQGHAPVRSQRSAICRRPHRRPRRERRCSGAGPVRPTNPDPRPASAHPAPATSVAFAAGGEGVSQPPLKDKAFSTFLDRNPPFGLRRPQNAISPWPQPVPPTAHHRRKRHQATHTFESCRAAISPPFRIELRTRFAAQTPVLGDRVVEPYQIGSRKSAKFETVVEMSVPWARWRR